MAKHRRYSRKRRDKRKRHNYSRKRRQNKIKGDRDISGITTQATTNPIEEKENEYNIYKNLMSRR
jgi:hypothetical protein